MKTFFWILVPMILMGSCTGSRTTHAGGSSKIPKKSYKSNHYHPDKKHYSKVDDVITDKSLKNAASKKKANKSSSAKYKHQQEANLKNLNGGTKYKNARKNDGIFIQY